MFLKEYGTNLGPVGKPMADEPSPPRGGDFDEIGKWTGSATCRISGIEKL